MLCSDPLPQQKLPKFSFRIDTTARWPVHEQSSILSTKFDSPVAHQNFKQFLVILRYCRSDLSYFGPQ